MKISALEIKRQLFHLLAGSALVALIYFDFVNALIMATLLGVTLSLSVISRAARIPLLYWFLKHLERPENLRVFPGKGIVFFLSGSLIALLLFQKEVALAAITILVVGDSVSPVVGRVWGRTKHPLSKSEDKMLEGNLTGTIAAFLAAMIFVSPIEAFAAASIAMAVEAVETKINEKVIDDNLIIPVVAGAVIALMRVLF